MAHKLTEQEQATVVRLAKLLGKELPVEFRGNAGGIASGLVRLRKNPLSEKDVRSVLERYDAAKMKTGVLVDLGVLEPQGEGAYALSTPEPRAIAKTERPKPPAKRDGRVISRLDTVRKQTPDASRRPSSPTSASRSLSWTHACGSTDGCSARQTPTFATSENYVRSMPRSLAATRLATAPSACASSPTRFLVTRSSWRLSPRAASCFISWASRTW